MKISVIVIAKNEELSIEKCYKSIKEACKLINHEVIFVDSNSSDNTLVEMKKKIKDKVVKVIQLKSNFYTAALARNIGAKNSDGEWLVFLDGDMELEKDFIKKLIFEKKIQTDIVGYVGERDDLFYDEDGNIFKEIKNVYSKSNKIGPAKKFGGALMINRAAFDEVNGYNSKLKTNEEMELYSRILSKNKIIQYTDKKMISHNIKYGKKTLMGKFLNFRYVYTGQALRTGVFNKKFLSLNYSLYLSLNLWVFFLLYVLTKISSSNEILTVFFLGIFSYLIIRLSFITKFKILDFFKCIFNAWYALFGFLLPFKQIKYTYEIIKD